MTATYATFVGVFPEFSASATYPEAGITFWLSQAYVQLSSWRFGSSLDLAAMLFAAHNTVLGAQAAATAATPAGIVGQASGPVQSKAVQSLSMSFDTGAVAIEGAGIYNQTQYGQRLWQLMKAYCSGPVYVPAPRRRSFAGRGWGNWSDRVF